MESNNESKTKKFTTAVAALIKAVAGFLSAPDERKDAERKKAIAENMGPIMEALNELLITPTKDDLVLMSMQVAVLAKTYMLRITADKRAEQSHVEKEVKELNDTIQNYLLYKAENLETQDPAENDKAINLIKNNISKAA